MIRIKDRRISNGRNVWYVTATLRAGGVDIDMATLRGDVTDTAGIAEALEALVDSKPRYQRAVRP